MPARTRISSVYGWPSRVLAEEPAQALRYGSLRRIVKTPLGAFQTCEQAALAHGTTAQQVLQKIRTRAAGWRFE